MAYEAVRNARPGELLNPVGVATSPRGRRPAGMNTAQSGLYHLPFSSLGAGGCGCGCGHAANTGLGGIEEHVPWILLLAMAGLVWYVTRPRNK